MLGGRRYVAAMLLVGGARTGQYALPRGTMDAMHGVLRGDGGHDVADAMGFVAAPLDRVIETDLAWHSSLARVRETSDVRSIDAAIAELSPVRHPWEREAFIDCGEWTAYLNEGSDAWPTATYLADQLGTQCVIALCSYEPPHASVQFQLLGPSGEPPLMFVRSLAAHCEDGQWTWHASGKVQPFEDVERYSARRIRDRLDRSLLVDYLTALGIHVDMPGYFGSGVLVEPR